MEQAFHWENYREPLIFLMTAGVVVPLFRRLRVSPVLGFLIAGALLGPYGIGKLAKTWPWLQALTIGEVEKAAHLAEFGVVFLLFMIGLELSWERLVRMRRLVFGLGAAQVAICTLVLTLLLAIWLDLSLGPALIAGAALAMSSTAIVIPVLSERRRLNRAAGRTSFAILLFQDLMVAPLLFIIPLLESKGAPVSGLRLFWTWAPAVAAMFILVFGGRLLLRPLFHLVAAARSTELFVAACPSNGIPSPAAPLTISSRLTLRANSFFFIFFITDSTLTSSIFLEGCTIAHATRNPESSSTANNVFSINESRLTPV